MNFPKFFHPPQYSNLERTQKATLLHYTLIISSLALLLFGLLNFYWGAITPGWMLLTVSGLFIAGVALNKTKHYYLAAILFAVLIFIAIFYNLVDGAALHDPGIATLPIYLILISIFFRRSIMPYFTLASILSIIVIFFFWRIDLLVLSQPPTLNRVIVLTILQVITGILSWMIVSTQHKTTGALDLSEDRYRILFEHAAEGISIHTGENYIDVNETWQKMFGRNKEEAIGRTPWDFSPKKQPNGLDSKVMGWELIKKAQGGIKQKFDWRHIRSDGTEFDTEIFLTIINISGEEVMISFVRDLTEQKRAAAAAQEERQRLARDLHDAVSQTLWSASLIADVLPDIWRQDPNKGMERLGRLRQLTHGALAELRALLLELRPQALVETNMAELLKRLIEATSSRSGAQISLAHDGECDLPEDVHITMYRVAQEALNNATHHAMASEIKIRLDCGSKHTRLAIADNGRGFDPEDTPQGQHLGLKIMGERATSIEASLEIISRSGEGTQVVLTWPDDGEVNDD